MSMRHVRVCGLLGCSLWLAACGGDGGGASSPAAPSGTAPPASPSEEMGSPGAAAANGSDDSASNGEPAAAGSESIDPDLGLTPGSSGMSDEAGANEGTVPQGTASNEPGTNTAEPAPTEPAPTEPTPAEPPAGEPAPAGSLALFLAGDSIVQTYADTPSSTDQAGWGQMLAGFFDDEVTVDNRAIGGRTARRFIDEGRLDDIVDELEPGDYLLVQFGTNDGNRTATYTLGDATIPYFLDPATDFRTYLQRYVDAARGRGANPLFVTPTPRNSAYCTGGNGTGAHAAAMKALGEEQGVPVVDLNAAAVAYLRQICPAPTPEDFFLLRADGTIDGTHFQENGARILASFVADGLAAIGAPFTAHRVSAQ